MTISGSPPKKPPLTQLKGCGMQFGVPHNIVFWRYDYVRNPPQNGNLYTGYTRQNKRLQVYKKASVLFKCGDYRNRRVHLCDACLALNGVVW